MAKKNASAIAPSAALTRESLRSFIVSANDIKRDEGEVFAGLNVLKLEEGQAAAGLVVSKISEQLVKGRGKEKGKTRKIPSYAATAPDNMEYRLPLNRSFVDKCQDAKLALGDTITLICEGAYTSKEGNKGVGYSLIVTARAKK
jgi:hypothetical protein